VDERIIEFVSHALSRRFAIKSLANKLYCTVQYIMKVLDGNPQARQFRMVWREVA
jgi:hypothetical protein